MVYVYTGGGDCSKKKKQDAKIDDPPTIVYVQQPPPPVFGAPSYQYPSPIPPHQFPSPSPYYGSPPPPMSPENTPYNNPYPAISSTPEPPDIDPGTTPYETLRVCKKHGGALFTIDRVDARTGQTTPQWILHRNIKEKAIALLYADGTRQQQQLGPDTPAATATFHTWFTSTIKVSIRGSEQFKVRGNGILTGHKWEFDGRKYRWNRDALGLQTSKLYFKDDSGKVVGRYLRKPDGRLKAENPTFELLVPAEQVDMDMFVGVGIAVAAFWAGQKKAEFSILKQLLSLPVGK